MTGDLEALSARLARKLGKDGGAGYLGAVTEGLHAPPARIDIDATPAERAALFDRIRRQWETLGDDEPYWSVLTDERFRRDAFEAHSGAFYASGAADAALSDQFFKRRGWAPPRGVCLELGCGVGRVTRALAPRFDRVVAVDVSPGNLALAKTALDADGAGDAVSLLRLSAPADLARVSHDFFFSLITLQHNPPPLIAALLEAALSALRPGGAFFFQLPTHHPGYAYALDADLAGEARDAFEMHCLPMHAVLRLLAAARCEVIDIRPDPYTGLPGSNIFFGRKTP